MSNLAIRSFAAGEIAPALYARTDQSRYEIALRTCRNFLVMRQGGATKRPGTEFITEVEDSSKKVRLIPFVFNVRQSFVLEFGNLYVRFIQNGGQVADPGDPTIPYEIVSPYLTADLPDLQYVQSGDVITIVHPSHPPYELVRHTNTNWGLNAIVFGPDLAAPIISSVTLGDPTITRDAKYVITQLNAAGEESLGSAPVTNANPPGSTNPVFIEAVTSGDTFRVYRQDGGSGVYGFIGEGIGPIVEYFDFGTIPETALQPPISKLPFVGADNYPSTVAYYQQRQIFANTNNNPDTVWASRTGYFKNFNISAIVQDDDAITFRLASDEVDAVRHVLNIGRLIIGTEGATWIIEGDGNGTLTPIAINARAATFDGMGTIKPVKSGASFLFLQALGSAVRQMQTQVSPYGSVSLSSADTTLFSSHLVDGFSVTDWAFQQEPLHVIWMVRSDGIMLGLTYIPEQEMLSWHRHDTDGWVENVCVVPEGRYHWVYVVVRRVIEGVDRRYIERMATTNVTPLFATPEEAATAPGGIITPPPPPPPPAPSDTAVSPPTSPLTTDIGTIGATFNWVAGNLLAPTEVGYRLTSGSDLDWLTTTVAGGLQSLVVTGLTIGTPYLWRSRHNLSGAVSSYTGPTAFTTLAEVSALTAPASAPTISNTVSDSGFTDITISWPASTQTASSEVQIAGPSLTLPDDVDFADLSVYAPGTTSAVDRITASGTYWLRVRYTKSGFDPSEWAGPSSSVVNVVDEV